MADPSRRRGAQAMSQESRTWPEGDQERRSGSKGAGRASQQPSGDDHRAHEHRTAKVIELVSSSRTSFEDAVRCALADARATTRGITGAHVENWSVKCNDGEVVEYKVNLKVSFGVERTPQPRPARGRRNGNA